MSSARAPAITDRQGGDSTAIGVDVGLKNLVTAAPAHGDVETAVAVDGSQIQTRRETLVESMEALQGAEFDTTDGEIQLFAAFIQKIRPEVHDAAARVVQYAQKFHAPALVLEDIGCRDGSLWERRADDAAGRWILTALQDTLETRARSAGIPVTYVSPKYTTQQCHECDYLAHVERDTVECNTDDCPVDEVDRDASAALTIAQRGNR